MAGLMRSPPISPCPRCFVLLARLLFSKHWEDSISDDIKSIVNLGTYLTCKALLTAARSNIRCRILMEIAAPIQRKVCKVVRARRAEKKKKKGSSQTLPNPCCMLQHESSCPMKLFYHVASANETQPTTAAVTCGGGRPLVNAVLLHPHMLRSQRGSCSRTTLSPHPSLSCGNA